MEKEMKPALIVDNGSGFMKAGFSGEERPKVVFPSVVGYPHHEGNSNHGSQQQKWVIGDQALTQHGSLTLRHPIEWGFVTHWDDLERLWSYTFSEKLQINPEEHPILCSEPPFNPKNNREKLTEVVFETFKFPAFYLALQAVLSLYSTGHTTGMVMESGDGVTYMVPISENYYLPHAVTRVNLAGRDLTEYLMEILSKKGHSFSNTDEREIARDMKEKLCFTSMNLNGDMAMASSNPASLERSYELPDGKKIALGNERFLVPEVLFRPEMIGVESAGIHELAHDAIMRCDIDLRKDMYENMILSGGNTLFPGMKERFEKEMGELAPHSVKVRTVAHNERKYGVWLGGSILSAVSSFNNNWVSRQEYLEVGPALLHRKFF